MDEEAFAAFRHKKVLITGGVGFIGSNLAELLVSNGAEVTIVDAMIPDCGGNLHNLKNIKDDVRLSFTDIGNESTIYDLVYDKDIIFNYAGHVSHIDSMHNPLKDLDINSRSQITFLEACRKTNPGVKIVFLGTRQVYGKTKKLPVDENHPIEPTDINGVNKVSGEWFHILYHNVYGMRIVSLRLTNTYGPRQLIRHNKQGFVGWFINRVITENEICIFGSGEQIRDFTYVDDANRAALLCALNDDSDGKIYNIGAPEHVSLKTFVEMLDMVCGGIKYSMVPFPDEKKKIDIGSYYADFSKIRREIGWEPRVYLEEGLTRTIEYFRYNREFYL